MVTTHVGAEAAGVTRYLQLASSLRARIQAGEWALGDQLPTVAQLAQAHAVAQVTVRHALQLLAREGLVVSTRGRGTFVSGRGRRPDERLRSAINDPMARARDFRIEMLGRRRGLMPPPELLGPARAAPQYVRLDKRHLHDGEPFCSMSLYVAADIHAAFPRGSDLQRKINGLLARTAGDRLADYQTTITIVPADHEVAAALKCPYAAATARIVRRVIDKAGVAVYAGLFWYRGDRFVLDIDMPASAMRARPDWLAPDAARA